MIKKIFTLVLFMAALFSCSHEDLPVQGADSQPMQAPVLSRSISASTATIAAYSDDGKLVFKHNLQRTDDENNIWEWYPAANAPTKAKLETAQDLVCLVPAQTITDATCNITPSKDASLMWGKMSVAEQHADKKFYFENLQHCLAKICVEVDHYYSSDKLYASYHPGGTFNCLTGEYTKLSTRTSTRIRPSRNSEGLYTYTFSVVPQTFNPEAELLRYRDEQSGGYRNYYHELPDTTVVLAANRMLHIHTQWNADWRKGKFVEYAVESVSLNTTNIVLDEGAEYQLIATVSPDNAYDKSVQWTSSDTNVATVDANGKVTAVAPGDATITATTTDGGMTATCEVRIIPYVTFMAGQVQTLTLIKNYDSDNVACPSVESIQYSVNGGAWKDFEWNTDKTISVEFGGTSGNLRMRGMSASGTASDFDNYVKIAFGNNEVGVACSGDIRTLVDYVNYSTASTITARFCNLFNGCTSLTTAPALPATTLATDCYSYMFNGCTSLTTAPVLPATSLEKFCYLNMFSNCTSLTTAPVLPATTLVSCCYMSMFNGCTNLESVTMLATNIPASNCLDYWLYDVADTGTFTKAEGMTRIPTNSESGIPTGWTVKVQGNNGLPGYGYVEGY